MAAKTQQRYTKLDTKGKEVAADAATWVAVRDNTTGLIWSARANIATKTVKHDAAAKACEKLKLAGLKGWRLPTIRELLTLVDYERHSPAIDTDYFHCQSSWYWTSTPAAPSPGDCAWLVYFGYGAAYWHSRGYERYVRAVRPSQS